VVYSKLLRISGTTGVATLQRLIRAVAIKTVMTEKKPNKWRFYGLDEPGIHVLKLIAYYMNGNKLEIRGEERKLGTHHDLPIEDMFRGSKWRFDDPHRYAHQRLLDSGLLREDYLCRRKIDWIPTEEGLKAMRDCLDGEDFCKSIKPEWAKEAAYTNFRWEGSDTGGPFYGDQNEGLVHRKGVEVIGEVLPYMSWTSNDVRLPYGVIWYPDDPTGKSSYDLYVKTNDKMRDVGVEVITNHNNTEQLVQKWKRYNSKESNTLWLFANRKTACPMFDALDSRGLVHLDGGSFSNPSNWSAKAINKKIWRSAEQPRTNTGTDLVQTLTGVLEGGSDTIQELFEDYYSNK